MISTTTSTYRVMHYFSPHFYEIHSSKCLLTCFNRIWYFTLFKWIHSILSRVWYFPTSREKKIKREDMCSLESQPITRKVVWPCFSTNTQFINGKPCTLTIPQTNRQWRCKSVMNSSMGVVQTLRHVWFNVMKRLLRWRLNSIPLVVLGKKWLFRFHWATWND